MSTPRPCEPRNRLLKPFPTITVRDRFESDRDAIYNDVFRRRVASMGILELISSVGIPVCFSRPDTERMNGLSVSRRRWVEYSVAKRVPGAMTSGSSMARLVFLNYRCKPAAIRSASLRVIPAAMSRWLDIVSRTIGADKSSPLTMIASGFP